MDAFSDSASIALNGWMAIFGSNFASSSRAWDDAIVGNTLPTSLSGVQVKVNNQLAPFSSDNRLYVTARALDGTTLGKASVDPSAVSGCGATNSAVPIDQIVEGSPRAGQQVDFPRNGNLCRRRFVSVQHHHSLRDHRRSKRPSRLKLRVYLGGEVSLKIE